MEDIADIIAVGSIIVFLVTIAAYFVTGAILRSIRDYKKRHKEESDGREKVETTNQSRKA